MNDIDKTCNRCSLHQTRKNVVAGEGLKESGVIILGEAPGVEEDLTGRPFVGAAGRLLDKMLIEAGLSRSMFYIDNIVHCRPCSGNVTGGQNRAPNANEIELCSTYFENSVKEIRPKIIVPTGNIPLKYVMGDRGVNISKKRGEFIWSEKYQCHIFPVYHPAAILRHYEYHATTVNDFKKLKSFLENRLPTSSVVDYKFIDDEIKLHKFFDEISPATEFAFDTECLTGDTVIVDPTTGDTQTLEMLYKKNTNTHASSFIALGTCGVSETSHVVTKGKKECFEIKTRMGSIKASAKHVFLTKRGWKKTEELTNSDYLVRPSFIRSGPRKQRLTDKECAFLGWWISEGCHTQDSVYFSTAEQEVVEDMKCLVAPYGCTVKKACSENTYRVSSHISSGRLPGGAYALGHFRKLLVDAGLSDQKASNKTIPQIIWQSPMDQIAFCLSRMYAGDGHVIKDRLGVNYSTASKLLAYQLQALLKRFKIVSYITEGTKIMHNKKFYCWCVSIRRYDNTLRFYNNIGIFGRKGKKLKQMLNQYARHKQHYRDYSRDSNNDFFYTKVTHIRSVGRKIVYDLTVPGPHNFVANDIVVHNTTGLDFTTDKLMCITFSTKERTAWCLPILDSVNLTPFWNNIDVISKLKHLFSNAAAKIAQNSKFDMLFLKKLGIDVNNLAFDTMLAHYLLDENAKEMHGLKSMAWEYTDMGGYDRELDEYQKANKLGKSMVGIPYEVLSKYAMGDADCTFRVYKTLKPMIDADGLLGLMTKLIMPLNYVLLDAEYHGVRIDVPTLQQLQIKFSADIIRLRDLIYTKAGRELNLNSPKQLIKLLFEDLKLKPVKRTKKNSLATDKSVLKELAKKHEIPKLLLEFRKVDKLYNTYMKEVEYDNNHRLHTDYSMSRTTTGRLTSSSPNLQNIPRDSEIKNMFTPKPGYVFIQLDFAQAEFRLWAQESKDATMIQDIKKGTDIHKETASAAFGIPVSEVTKDQRTAAKNATFGIMYGRGYKSIAEQYAITETKAKEIIDEFFKKYPTAARWIQHIVLLAKQQGWLRNFFGRKRRLIGLYSPDKETQSMAERQAKNFLMQSGSADLTNWLSVRLFKLLKSYDTRLVLNVHDSLVYEVPECHRNTVLDIIRTEAARPISGFEVPMVVDIQVGTRWGDMKSSEKYQEELEDE